MGSPRDTYLKEMASKFGYLATWTPGTAIALGDVGVVRNNVFTRTTTLREHHIAFAERSDSSEEVIEHTTSGSVSVLFKAAGQMPATGSALSQADAGLVLEFTRDRSVVFKAAGCTAPSIEDPHSLGEQIKALYAKGEWNKDWVVVTEVVRAKSGAVLIADRRGARIEISGKGNLSAGAFDLADASLGLTINSKRDMETTLLSPEGFTPLFQARSLQGRGPIAPLLRSRGLQGVDVVVPAKSAAVLEFRRVRFITPDDGAATPES